MTSSAGHRLRLDIAAAAVLAAVAATPVLAQDNPAAALVSSLAADVEELTSLPLRDEEERAIAVRRLLHEYFNLPLVGRAVLGRHWRTITDAQKEAYQHAFEDHTVHLIDAQLDLIAGGALTILRTVSRNEREAFVYSHFTRAGENPLEVQWRFRNRKSDGKPRIVDVAVEGVSLFTTKRQDFAAIMEAEGIEGLVNALRSMHEASL